MNYMISSSPGVVANFVALIAKSHGLIIIVGKCTGETPGHRHLFIRSAKQFSVSAQNFNSYQQMALPSCKTYRTHSIRPTS